MKLLVPFFKKLFADQHLLDQMLVSGTTFLLQMVLAAMMGLELFGIFSGWQITGLIVLGIQQAFFVAIHQVNYRDGKSTGHHYSMQVFYLNFLTIIFVASLLSLLALAVQNEMLNLSFIWSLAAWLLFDTLRRISLTEGKLKAVLWADGIYVFVLAMCLCVLFIGHVVSPFRVILAMCLAYLSASLVIWQSLPKVVFQWKSLRIVWHMHWKQAKWLVATNVLQMAGSNLFLLCCGWWIGATALGSLRLVQSVFGVFSLFFQYFENKYMPSLASSSDHKPTWTVQMKSMFAQMNRVGLVMIALAMVALFPIYYFFGLDLALLVIGFLILQICIVMGIPVRMGIRSQKENKSIFSAYIYSSIFSIVSAKWLITAWGANGAVIGLCLAQVIMIIYWMKILKSKFNFQWKLYM